MYIHVNNKKMNTCAVSFLSMKVKISVLDQETGENRDWFSSL